MATTSSRRTPGVGGKIVKNNNRSFNRVTPYSRPISSSSPSSNNPQSDDSENPNWLSGLIYPAKVIANGAGKILSFFGNDYSSSSSSSDDDEDDDDEETGNDVSFQEDGQLDKVLSPSNKSDNKQAIEQLVIQETYSRKEANELIKLVKSRIVDNNGETTPNVRTAAILEARKWLQENRSGSKKFENELDFSNVASPSHTSKNEKGSPVDMARSYMQNRPAWGSPSGKKAEIGSSSPLGMLHFKDKTPKSTRRSSELKKGSFASGSWNLLEEIRRVRTKASEELLASAPLTKTVLSSFSPESNPPHDPTSKKGDVEALESTHERPDNVLPDAARSTPSRASQDGDAAQSAEREGFQEAPGLTHYTLDKSKQLKRVSAGNGFGCSASGSAPGHETTHEARPSEEGNGNLVDSGQGGRDIHMEENLTPQEDPVIDIPDDGVINGSQNSSSLKQEDNLQDVSQPITEDGATAKVKDTTPQKERKLRGSTRRARGKGK